MDNIDALSEVRLTRGLEYILYRKFVKVFFFLNHITVFVLMR